MRLKKLRQVQSQFPLASAGSEVCELWWNLNANV